MSAVLDALHKRYHNACAVLGDLHAQRARLDERIDLVTAEIRAIQRAADAVPPATSPATPTTTEGAAP